MPASRTTDQQTAKYIQDEFGSLVGKTIQQVRPLTETECEDFGWDTVGEPPFVLLCTDGTAIIPSQDPEGNGPGFLFLASTEPVR